MTQKLFVYIFVCCAISVQLGCVVNRKFHYHDIPLNVGYSGTRTVGVAVHDQRPLIQSGEKLPTYTGTVRGGFGNPFDAWTESGRPLSEDFMASICESLKKRGFATFPVSVNFKDSQQSAKEKLLAANGDRFIMVTVKEWYSESYVNVSLYFDVTLQVLDKRGAALAEASAKGEDGLGGSGWDPAGYAYDHLPDYFKKKFEQLLNDQKVMAALK